jgi:chaperone BCS1
MRRERETKAINMMTHTPWETVTLTTLSRDRNLLSKLLDEARDHSLRQKEGKMTVHTAWGTEWRPFGKPRRKRPLESIVLAEDVAERIEHDLRSFLERRSWYTERG